MQIKRFITGIPLLFTFIYISAQGNIPTAIIFPRAGDRIIRETIDYIPETDSNEINFWDLRETEIGKQYSTIIFSETEDSLDMIVGTEHNTRYYYYHKEDSLFLGAFENNANEVWYNKPQFLLHSPLTLGNHHDSYFCGSGIYCENMYVLIFGSNKFDIDGYGAIILPSGDTLTHVSRVHVNQQTYTQQYPSITSKKELFRFKDSLTISEDSIMQHLQSDSIINETNIYRWYALGYRYPILEKIEKSLKGAEPYETTCFYYDPEFQKQLTDEENDYIRNWVEENKGNFWGNLQNDNEEQINQDLFLKNISVSAKGNIVQIQYEQTIDATVFAQVCNVMGIVYRQSSKNGSCGEISQIEINCNGLPKGEYVVYLSINGQAISSTVNIE